MTKMSPNSWTLRPLVVLALLLGSLSPSLLGQPFRVAIWDLDGFETISIELLPSEAESKRLRLVAAHLKPLDADIIVLQGIADRHLASGVASFLKPAVYHVALHATFKKAGANSATAGSPIAILSKRPPYVARTMEWRATGQIDSPGGFAFAGFSVGTNALCVYVAQLPGDPIAPTAEAESRLFARKRELAGQYLVHHANWLGGTLPHQSTSFLIAGNYAVDPRTNQAEASIRILQQAGFQSGFPIRSSVNQGNSQNAPPLLTGLMGRNGNFSATPQALVRRPFAQPILTYNFQAGAPTLPANAPVAATPITPSMLVELDAKIIWLWVGGIGVLSGTVLLAVWLARRTAARPETFRRAGNSVVLDLSGFSRPPRRTKVEEFNESTAESYSGSTTDADQAQATLWQARALQAEQRADQAAVAARAGLVPYLGQLVRQRLFSWLVSQRSQLLTSHETGTQQVLELEERLQSIQRQFEERLKLREERIAELERDILAREKVIRDLLRAQVRTAEDSAE